MEYYYDQWQDIINEMRAMGFDVGEGINRKINIAKRDDLAPIKIELEAYQQQLIKLAEARLRSQARRWVDEG